MDTLWHRMGELYGHARWQAQYGPAFVQRKDSAGVPMRDENGKPLLKLSSTVETWRRSLRGITLDEIGRGIAECIKRNEDWPPSVPQFRERCRPARMPYEREAFTGKALPLKKADPATAQRHIDAILGRNKPSHHRDHGFELV